MNNKTFNIISRHSIRLTIYREIAKTMHSEAEKRGSIYIYIYTDNEHTISVLRWFIDFTSMITTKNISLRLCSIMKIFYIDIASRTTVKEMNIVTNKNDEFRT